MNIAIVNDIDEKTITEIVVAGRGLGEKIVIVTPQNFIESAIKKANLIIICKIKHFAFSQIRTVLNEITERCCQYVNFEFDYDKLKHPYIGYSHYMRSLVNFFKEENMVKHFLSHSVSGMFYGDVYLMFNAIHSRTQSI